MSSVTWLDTSAEEQRHVREVLSLFAQSESRDELGIGQIRDAFSDLLFPGTSVVQTRARCGHRRYLTLMEVGKGSRA